MTPNFFDIGIDILCSVSPQKSQKKTYSTVIRKRNNQPTLVRTWGNNTSLIPVPASQEPGVIPAAYQGQAVPVSIPGIYQN